MEQPVYKYLETEAKKTANEIIPTVKADINNDGDIIIEISLTLKANGEPLLGIEALKNHNLTLSFTIKLSMNSLNDIKMGNTFDMTMAVTETVGFDIKLTSVELENLTDEEKKRSNSRYNR